MISTNRPNGLLGPCLCSLIGEPNPNWLVGPCHTAHTNREGGDRGSFHEVERSRHPPTENTLIRSKGRAASDGMCPNHRRRTYAGSPQRHWIYTGPLVIVSVALDAFHTDGIGVYPLRCIHGEDEDAYPILRSQRYTYRF